MFRTVFLAIALLAAAVAIGMSGAEAARQDWPIHRVR